MVDCVSGAMEGSQSSAFGRKFLPVLNVQLRPCGSVLEDLHVRAEFEQVLYAADVIGVPVGQERFSYCCKF